MDPFNSFSDEAIIDALKKAFIFESLKVPE